MKMEYLTTNGCFAALGLSDYLNEIMAPIKIFGITYFQHIRIFNNSSRIYFSNKKDWLINFFNKEYFFTARYSGFPAKYTKDEISLWATKKDKEVILDAKKNFNIDNGITIIKTYTHHKDFYLFSSSFDNFEINNFYLNNLNILEHFILYYLEKFQNKLNMFNNIIQPHNSKPSVNATINQEKNLHLETFANLTKIKKYYTYHENKEYFLPRSAYLCARYLSEGKTVKWISTHLNLSTRTCYHYIDRVKLNIYSTEKLIEAIKKQNIQSIII